MKFGITISVAILVAAASAAGFDQYFVRDTQVASDRVTALTFDVNGRYLAYGTNDGRVEVVDMADGSSILATKNHDKDVAALAFAPGGRYLVSGSRDKDIIIWDLTDGIPAKTIEDFGAGVAAIDISPDGRYLAACGDKKKIMLWEFPSGFLRGELEGHDKNVVLCGFDELSDRLVSVAEDGNIIAWDIKALRPLRQNRIAAHTLPNSGLDIVSAALSDDRRFLGVGIEEHALAKGGRGMEFRHTIAFYDWNTGTLLKVLEGNNKRVDRLTLSPDMTCLVTDNSPMHSHELAFWDILGGVIETSYPIEGDITTFDMSMDGGYLVAAYRPEDGDAHIVLWEITGIAGYAPPASDVVTPLAETGFGGTISLTGPEEPIISDALPHTLAVMNLDAYGIDDDIARFISDNIEGRMVNTVPCVRMIERNRIDLILKELKYAQSGMTDQRALEVGQHLEAQYLLYGTVRKTGHDLTVSVKLADVESAGIVGSRGVMCTNASLRDIFDMVAYLVPTIAACGDQ